MPSLFVVRSFCARHSLYDTRSAQSNRKTIHKHYLHWSQASIVDTVYFIPMRLEHLKTPATAKSCLDTSPPVTAHIGKGKVDRQRNEAWTTMTSV